MYRIIFILVVGCCLLFGCAGLQIPSESIARVSAAKTELTATLAAMYGQVEKAKAQYPNLTKAVEEAAQPVLDEAKQNIAAYDETARNGGGTKASWSKVWPFVSESASILLPAIIKTVVVGGR